MKQKIPKNKHKAGDKIGEWKRIFKFLPVVTEDGYRVTFGYVWSRRVPTGLDWETLYHTNPGGRETLLQAKNMKLPLTEGKMRHGSNPMPPCKRPKRPPPPPAPPPPRRVDGRPNSFFTTGEPKELPKNKKLGYYTGSTGPG